MQIADVSIEAPARVAVSRAAVLPGSDRTTLVGLIGMGIQPSRMPALHEREGAALGLAYIYRLVDVAARRFAFTGLNVTHPCKQAIIPLLDGLSPHASALGAVNTVVFAADGRLVGHNTDWSGFAESFRRELADVPRQRVVLLGAGGAGAAVAHALLTLGVGALSIIDTEGARADRLAAGLRDRFGEGRAIAARDLAAAVDAADGIVNATPVGMANHAGMPVARELLRPDLWVAEIIYFPPETKFLHTARELGCRTMAGGGMAVFQAAEAFRLFTGREPDTKRMIRHFETMEALR